MNPSNDRAPADRDSLVGRNGPRRQPSASSSAGRIGPRLLGSSPSQDRWERQQGPPAGHAAQRPAPSYRQSAHQPVRPERYYVPPPPPPPPPDMAPWSASSSSPPAS
jgi:hypothetical protein